MVSYCTLSLAQNLCISPSLEAHDVDFGRGDLCILRSGLSKRIWCSGDSMRQLCLQPAETYTVE